jgi:hypothetical protein
MARYQFIDITGKKFGSWTVIDISEKSPEYTWNVKCDCGTNAVVAGSQLRKGRSKSCGCQIRYHKTHGMSGTITYSSWRSMIKRCHDPNHDQYPRYGGSGINVCKRWLDFSQFFNDMGERPSKMHSIDRTDNARGYEPDNCRWATKSEQSRNTKSVVWVTIDGVTRCVAEWAEIYCIPHSRLLKRIHAGWAPKRAVLAPSQRSG